MKTKTGPTTGYWLQHMVSGKRDGRFVLTHVTSRKKDGIETVIDTGSGVQVLRLLRRLHLSIPDIMGGPKCFETEWTVGW